MPSPVSTDGRPALILVAVDIGRHLGSEPGRAWAWACGLARHFKLHIIAPRVAVERCRHEDVAADWQWHSTRCEHPAASGIGYYREYRRWCREVSSLVQGLRSSVRPVALHHITLGSFRVLPRYHRCGVPYTLGPLGGGETTPRTLLRTARLPLGPRLSEMARPWLNNAFAAHPSLRAVMRGSRLALATSRETERVLQRMGARRTVVAYPDRVPADVDPRRAQPAAERAADLGRCVRLVWSGRAVWWKAGQLAVELLRRLVVAGINAELTVFSQGHALPAWRRQMQAAGVDSRCRVSGFVARSELLVALGRAHAFVYPTLHDSSSPALLEAYAMGLPSLTVGLGGPAVIATTQTGYNESTDDLNAWLDGAVDRVRAWQNEPSLWVAASEAARERAAGFGADYLETLIDRWLAPVTWAQ